MEKVTKNKPNGMYFTEDEVAIIFEMFNFHYKQEELYDNEKEFYKELESKVNYRS